MFSVIPKLLGIAVYFVFCGYALFILNYGFNSFIKIKLFYHPYDSVRYAYDYVLWVIHSENLEIWILVICLISAIAPLLIARIAVNLYYMGSFLALNSVKNMGLKEVFRLSNARRNSRSQSNNIVSAVKQQPIKSAISALRGAIASVKFSRANNSDPKLNAKQASISRDGGKEIRRR